MGGKKLSNNIVVYDPKILSDSCGIEIGGYNHPIGKKLEEVENRREIIHCGYMNGKFLNKYHEFEDLNIEKCPVKEYLIIHNKKVIVYIIESYFINNIESIINRIK